MAKASSSIRTVACTMVHGTRTKCMVTVHSTINQANWHIRACGSRTSSKARASSTTKAHRNWIVFSTTRTSMRSMNIGSIMKVHLR